MPFTSFTPPESNTQPIAPQIEAQSPLGPHRGGISTFMFILIIAVLGAVIYAVVNHQPEAVRQEAKEAAAQEAEANAARPNAIDLDEAIALVRNIDVYKFTGTNNAGQFTVNPGNAECDTTLYKDDNKHSVLVCRVPVDPTTNPVNESFVLINITVDWTKANEPVKCEFFLGETSIADVDCK